MIVAPAAKKTTAATGCAVVHTTPEKGNGITGFQSTAIARKTGIHHQWRACSANHPTISPKIEAMKRTSGAQFAWKSAGARNRIAAATRLGARAFRW